MEVKFFLEKMESSLDDPEILVYYVSAFLSAARSVTLVMQFEIGKNHEFKNWYTGKQEEMKKNKIFNLFNSLRVETIHLEGKIRFRRKVSLQIIEARVKQPPRGIEMYFDDLRSKSGTELCKKYLEELNKIVSTAEQLVCG